MRRSHLGRGDCHSRKMLGNKRNLARRRGIVSHIPPHFVSFKKDAAPWTLKQAQLWNC